MKIDVLHLTGDDGLISLIELATDYIRVEESIAYNEQDDWQAAMGVSEGIIMAMVASKFNFPRFTQHYLSHKKG